MAWVPGLCRRQVSSILRPDQVSFYGSGLDMFHYLFEL